MKSQGNTIFQVQFKATGKDHFFGSIAAIYDKFTPKEIGVSQQRLYDFDIDEDRPYSNKLCTIKKTSFHRKPGNRKKDRVVAKKIVVNSRFI